MVLIPCSLWLSHLQKEHIKASGAHRGREPAFFSWDNSFLQATQDFTTITCSFCLKPSRRPFLCARAELQQEDEGIGELYSPSLPQPSPSLPETGAGALLSTTFGFRSHLGASGTTSSQDCGWHCQSILPLWEWGC